MDGNFRGEADNFSQPIWALASDETSWRLNFAKSVASAKAAGRRHLTP